MTRRRVVSIYDYPEHLNPFREIEDNGLDRGSDCGRTTWGRRHKIKLFPEYETPPTPPFRSPRKAAPEITPRTNGEKATSNGVPPRPEDDKYVRQGAKPKKKRKAPPPPPPCVPQAAPVPEVSESNAPTQPEAESVATENSKPDVAAAEEAKEPNPKTELPEENGEVKPEESVRGEVTDNHVEEKAPTETQESNGVTKTEITNEPTHADEEKAENDPAANEIGSSESKEKSADPDPAPSESLVKDSVASEESPEIEGTVPSQVKEEKSASEDDVSSKTKEEIPVNEVKEGNLPSKTEDVVASV